MRYLFMLGLVVALGAAATDPAAAAGRSCDAGCLKGFVDKYLAALVAHDPARLNTADDARFTENGQELQLGEALWATASGVGKYKNYFTDPVGGEVGFFGTVQEGSNEDILALRLKIVDRKIAEVETVVARPTAGGGPMSNGAANLEQLGKPNSLWSQKIPKSERMSREELIKTANMYFSGLEKNDGKGVYPFTDDCNRLENGTQTTNVKLPPPPAGTPGAPAADSPFSRIAAMGCKEQFASGLYNMVARIRDRRFMVVDPEHGAVFTFVFFDHDGRPPPPVTVDGKTFQGNGLLWTWEIAEAFKIEKGEIRFVEAVMTQAPYGMKPNWPH